MERTEDGLKDRRQSALIAGGALLLMALAAAFSVGFVHGSLLVPEDGLATLQNVTTHYDLYTAGMFGWLVILLSDVAAAWSLYIFLKPVHSPLSLLGAWFRLVYSAILGVAIMNLVMVQLLAPRAGSASGEPSASLGDQAELYLQAFDSIWSIGLIVFGGHLLMLGVLALRSGDVPKAIGCLLLISAAGYIVVHLASVFFAQYEPLAATLERIFVLPMTVGELGFGLWLLLRGGRRAS